MTDRPVDLRTTLATLLGAAEATKKDEIEVRRDADRRLAALEAVRARAYRRHHFVELLGHAARTAPDPAAAIATQRAVLAERFGWQTPFTKEQEEIFDALAPIMAAVAGVRGAFDKRAVPEEPQELIAALDRFEAWFTTQFGTEVWRLFDRFKSDRQVDDLYL